MVNNLIERQAAIDVVRRCSVKEVTPAYMLIDKAEVMTELMMLPSAQPEQSNASEFWRKRADYYSNMCMNLIGEMNKDVKIKSVKISENGIEFIKEQPSVQPEIVRCKDCKHNPKEAWFGCPASGLNERQRPETAWCWKGERK